MNPPCLAPGHELEKDIFCWELAGSKRLGVYLQGRVVGWLGLPYYSGKPLKGLKPSGLNSKGIILVTMIYRLGDGGKSETQIKGGG